MNVTFEKVYHFLCRYRLNDLLNYISKDPSGMSSRVLYVTVTDVSKDSGWFTFSVNKYFSDFLALIVQYDP